MWAAILVFTAVSVHLVMDDLTQMDVKRELLHHSDYPMFDYSLQLRAGGLLVHWSWDDTGPVTRDSPYVSQGYCQGCTTQSTGSRPRLDGCIVPDKHRIPPRKHGRDDLSPGY